MGIRGLICTAGKANPFAGLTNRIGLASAVALAIHTLLLPAKPLQAQPVGRDQEGPQIPAVAVTGQGEVSAPPDRAVLRVGAEIQSKVASDAQQQVNRIMQNALSSIKALGISEPNIKTDGLSLSPVYTNPQPTSQPTEPRITGYRASNTLSVTVDNLDLVGKIIDAGVSAGANQLQELSFELKDDSEQRRGALKRAVEDAQAKAEAISSALHLSLVGVLEVSENGVRPIPRKADFALAGAFRANAPTPVQPGEVRVEATVTVRYRLGPAK